MLFEITNTEGTYTLAAESERIALAAVYMLGNGRYGIKPKDGEENEQAMMFEDEGELLDHLDEVVGDDFETFKVERARDIAQCLSTVMPLGFEERAELVKTMAGMDSEQRAVVLAEAAQKARVVDVGLDERAWTIARQLAQVGR